VNVLYSTYRLVIENVAAQWAATITVVSVRARRLHSIDSRERIDTNPLSGCVCQTGGQPMCDTPAPGYSYQVFRWNVNLGTLFQYIRYPVDTQEVRFVE